MMDSQAAKIKHLQPLERIKHLINFSNQVEVDYNVSPKKYYRSGLEMVRMANVYLSENNLENAYVLYLKFMTLFLEKIRKHPDFNVVSKQEKVANHAMVREILPKAELLKAKLLEKYEREHAIFLEEFNKQEAEKSKVGGTDVKVEPKLPASLNTTFDEGSFLDQSLMRGNLRTVVVPSKVMSLFQVKAENNSINNIETCGILAGKLANNVLTITHMILPKQRGNSDSCVTMNEEELFEFQDHHNLITIGWIHTHPTQSAFLSSVDLHTHLPYQILMSEAIAIVVSPKHNESGIFTLTPNHGVHFITKCRETGFHPHPKDPPLFMIAEHVKIDYSAALEVMDMRTKI